MNVKDLIERVKLPGALWVIILVGASTLIQANMDENSMIGQLALLLVAAVLKYAQERSGVTVEVKQQEALDAFAPSSRSLPQATVAPKRGILERVIWG